MWRMEKRKGIKGNGVFLLLLGVFFPHTQAEEIATLSQTSPVGGGGGGRQKKEACPLLSCLTS